MTLSSTEVEYLALIAAVKEALSLFLRNLIGDHSTAIMAAARLPIRSRSCMRIISLLKQQPDRIARSGRSHVDIRHHFLKAHVANGDVYLPIAHRPADALEYLTILYS